MIVIFSNGAGELDREPVEFGPEGAAREAGSYEPDAVKEAVERLVSRVGFFALGDVITIVEG